MCPIVQCLFSIGSEQNDKQRFDIIVPNLIKLAKKEKENHNKDINKKGYYFCFTYYFSSLLPETHRRIDSTKREIVRFQHLLREFPFLFYFSFFLFVYYLLLSSVNTIHKIEGSEKEANTSLHTLSRSSREQKLKKKEKRKL